MYGSVYAIADISYCAAYAFGPVLAGKIVADWGFTTLNIIVAVLSLMYAPIIYYLKVKQYLKMRIVYDNCFRICTVWRTNMRRLVLRSQS